MQVYFKRRWLTICVKQIAPEQGSKSGGGFFHFGLMHFRGKMVKNLPAMQDTLV